ncbi:MAG: transglycosylase SLT domain-containing protein, partial [Deltaproteobacteria bacterium]|nr:transglycosylase SLT domain-containing protein [Deltaproteobacteria bacterium]
LAVLSLSLFSASPGEAPPPPSGPAGALFQAVNTAFPPSADPGLPPAAAAPVDMYDEARLTPYFADGELRAAREAVEEGRFARARALLAAAAQTAPVRYLAAYAALKDGDEEASAAAFEAIAPGYPALSDRCHFYAGRARAGLGQAARAAEQLLAVPEQSRLFVDARVLLARAQRTARQLSAARASLAPVLEAQGGRRATPECWLLAADLARELKDVQGERTALSRVWARFPASSQAREAEARMKRLKADFADVDVVDRAESLLDAHRTREVVALLSPKLASLSPRTALGCRAHFYVGKALRKDRQFARTISALEPLAAECGDPDTRARALYLLASAQSFAKPADGLRTYVLLAEEQPQHPFADDALYFAADLESRAGRDERALALLEKIPGAPPLGDYAADALFRRAWLLRRAGKLDEAAALLRQARELPDENPEAQARERATYWLGRVQHARGEVAGAVSSWEELVSTQPASYYGGLAREELARVDPAAARRAAAEATAAEAGRPILPADAGALGAEPRFLAGVELLRLGFTEVAVQELLSATRAQASPSALRLLVLLLSRAGDTRMAHWVARTALRKELGGRISVENRSLWELAYPTAYRDLVERHAGAAGLDPDLLQGLMREESALDPRARSWVGALGLTQLMPGTARVVAKKLKLPAPSHAALLDPELNLRLGATFLGELLQKWGGEMRYAVGSYNAGPQAVRKWLDARPTLARDEWVEEIPIAETRNYVKRVLRSYYVYQLLTAPREPQLRSGAGAGAGAASHAGAAP